MNERDLDRIIDRATAEMIGRAPNRSLRRTVLARVQQSRTRAPRRLTWATSAAAAILCGAIAIAVLNRVAAPIVTGRNGQLSEPAAGAPVLVPPGERTFRESAPAPIGDEAAQESALPATRSAENLVQTAALPPNDLITTIEPIDADPLVLSSIEVPPIENPPNAVDPLEIEALTIEPVTASND